MRNSAVEAGYMEFRPTLIMRLRRWAGFRYHFGEEPKETDDLKWSRTDMRLHFGIADRLRLLLTGRLKICLTSHISEDFLTVKTRMDWQIFAPGEADGH